MIKKLFFTSFVALTFVSCKTAIQPNYVTTKEVASLNTGMSKDETKSILGNLSPFDILMAQQGGCEVHLYKYKSPAKEISSSLSTKKEGLSDGDRKFVKESDVYLVFKNGKLESVLTNIGKSDASKLIGQVDELQSVCSEEGLKGCTDPASLNYSSNAIFDDGSCEYCACGTTKNPDFNANRPISDCNQKCIKTTKEDDKQESNNCSNCDIIDKLTKANTNVNINLQLPTDNTNGTSTKKSDSNKLKSVKKFSVKK